jgi:hypothetical protein
VECNVPVAEGTQDEAVLPERVQEALGRLVGVAREGLLALSVEVGLGVLRELLEAEVDQIVGPKGKGRSRWAGGGLRSIARGSARRTASRRCRLRPTSISPTATSSRTWCWSGCCPASRPASIGVCRSRLASRSRTMPGAASSLPEGMEETLTVTRLGITGKLKCTLQSTNPCESMISTVRAINRNVKNWSSGEMALRWTAAGMLEAETRVRKVEGYHGLANLAITPEHDLTQRRQKEPTATLTV